jgi:energy-coupling factor transporter ATP-binding protein EcfA2
VSDYKGMRWVRCDLQVQTPEDAAHWADADTRLPEPRRRLIDQPPGPDGLPRPRVPNEKPLQAVAQAFLKRCHELGLEMVGITDHNFSQHKEPRDWFLTHLVEQNRSVAKTLGRAPIAILPGFEVDIGYHVLCLFSPARSVRHVWRVNTILTRLGLVEDARCVRGVPQELRSNGATVSLKALLEVVQGEHGGMVIAAHADQTDGLLENARNRHDYQNFQLLAAEVTTYPVAERYREILEGRNREWGRSGKPPALVMSSDAKSLKVDRDTQQPGPNSLGYRHSWLKMSAPSIEALRQSFLDPSSRIVLKGSNPSEAQTHPRIRSVEVKGAKLLDDMSLTFSENLNCIIGGRGSGKSTLLEYLHFALNDGPEVPRSDDPALQKKKTQLVSSLAGTGEVRVKFETGPGLSDVLVYRPGANGQPMRTLEGRQVLDLATVLRQLRAAFFSQGELSRMTTGSGGQAHVLEIIDAAASVELQQTWAAEADLKLSIGASFQARREVEEVTRQLEVAKQEIQELDRQLEARESVREDSRRHQGAVECVTFVRSVKSSIEGEADALAKSTEGLREPRSAQPTDYWPKQEWLTAQLADVNDARAELAGEVGAALQRFRAKYTEALGEAASLEFTQETARISKAFADACEQKGLRPEDISKLTELMEARKTRDESREKLEERLRAAQETAGRLPTLLGQLHALWRDQFGIRRRTADAMQATMSQMARIQTAYMGDMESFMTQWSRLTPKDGRAKLSKRWEELGIDVHRVWRERTAEDSPWETVELAPIVPRLIPFLYGELAEDLQPLMTAHLKSADVSRLWDDVRITRVSDGIDVELLTEEGHAEPAAARRRVICPIREPFNPRPWNDRARTRHRTTVQLPCVR